MEFSVGQVVISKAGRDLGQVFIILRIEDNFAYLADGKLRKVGCPKKKKFKHLQPTKYIDYGLKAKIDGNLYIKDSDIREALEKFLRRPNG